MIFKRQTNLLTQNLFICTTGIMLENIYFYIPFYLCYILMVVLQVLFAQTALGIGRRYRRLNIALQNLFANGKIPHLI